MPHAEDGSLVIRELHPTFAAEIHDVDFTHELSPEVFAEIHRAITKVSNADSSYSSFVAEQHIVSTAF